MAAVTKKPINLSKELATLQHEKKNQSLKKLPPDTHIQRRPLSHPAIAPPQAGSHVPKVVYVSRHTPIMSAVKRVKKLLHHIEKRALQGIESKPVSKTRLDTNLRELSEKLAKNSEEVLVKASGRAMEQALRIGEWFRTKETEFICKVEIRTGSTAAVDDIVVDDSDELASHYANEDSGAIVNQENPEEPLESTLEGGDTTMELLSNTSMNDPEKSLTDAQLTSMENSSSVPQAGPAQHRRKRKKKRKREVYDANDMPEARIRWVKTVEVAISLKG